MSSFSNYGPDDGRIKPDISAKELMFILAIFDRSNL
jgi:hypothetical protein